MATLYITSTANTGTGTLRTLISSATAGDTIQPAPEIFPKGTLCSVSLTETLSINTNGLNIKGGQTRLVITSTGAILHYVTTNYYDVDFIEMTSNSDGCILQSNSYSLYFTRCSFCGLVASTAPIFLNNKKSCEIVCKDCAFYGNRASRKTTGGYGAVCHGSSANASNSSYINCTFGANFSSSGLHYNYTPGTLTNTISSVDEVSEWRTPPPSSYTYNSWTATAYKSMDPRPSSTASWRTGATSTTSTVDLDGNPRKSNGAKGAYEYYVGKLATPDVTVVQVQKTGAMLQWLEITNRTSFTVRWRAQGASTWNQMTTTSRGVSFSTLTPGTTYEYEVVAVGGVDYAPSNAAAGTFTTVALPPLASPTSLSSYDITHNSATVSWGEVANASGYKIEYRPSGASNWSEETM